MKDPLLAKHPDWIGIGNTGDYSNYNGTDYYLNSYRTEVRTFMLDLMKEYPQFTFAQSQASTYRIIEEYAPWMLDEIRSEPIG